jgi:hypothetical protein
MESTIVRNNLMTREGYAPYCGNGEWCLKGMPRTKWDAEKEQFVCSCGWTSKIAPDFIKRYKERWGK